MMQLAKLAGAIILAVFTFAPLAATSQAAAGKCFVKAAEGTGGSEQSAKFQAYEALLQATDWGAWASWMASGTTPGYKVSTPKYRCTKGTGLGVTCRGQATICRI